MNSDAIAGLGTKIDANSVSIGALTDKTKMNSDALAALEPKINDTTSGVTMAE